MNENPMHYNARMGINNNIKKINNNIPKIPNYFT
jgi:hypothetical protein